MGDIEKKPSGARGGETGVSSAPVVTSTGYLPLVIFIWGILVFGNTLKDGFVFDDHEVIRNNKIITDFRNIPVLFSHEYFSQTIELSYRPVVTFTYFLDCYFFVYMTAGYHLVNVIIHILNAFLLFILLRRLLVIFMSMTREGTTVPALLGSLFFLLHPAVTEPVNVISYREDLLCACFSFLALLCYMESMKRKGLHIPFLAFTSFTFLLAAFSKETAIVVPFIILLLDILYTLKKGRRLSSKNFARLAFLFVPLVFYVVIRFAVMVPTSNQRVEQFGGTAFGALLNFPRFIVHYLALLVWPVRLSADYNFKAFDSFIHPVVIGSWICIILFLVTIVYFWIRKNYFIVIAVVWFFLFLLPVSNIVPLANPVADRYLYLPLAGIAGLLASFVTYIMGWTRADEARLPVQRVLLVCLAVVFVLYSAKDISRNKIWHDDFTLWTETIKAEPRSVAAHRGLGLIYLEKNEFDTAKQYLEKAVNLKPEDIRVRNNLSVLYARSGEVDKAITQLHEILKLYPGYPTAHFNLAKCYTALTPPAYGKALREAREAKRLGYPVPDQFIKKLEHSSVNE
jgi:hypothetical protein